MPPRPAIPEVTKREVRRRCYFGCIICGLPVWEYDHIVPYAVVGEHKADNIVLLCRLHHGEKTAARLSQDTLLHFVRNPANSQGSRSAAHRFLMRSQRAELVAGSNVCRFDFGASGGRFDAIRVGALPVLGLTNEAGQLLLDVVMMDAVGNDILRIDRGELTIDPGVWDYRFSGPRFEVRGGPGMVVLSMQVTETGLVIHRGLFSAPPVRVDIMPDRILIEPGHATLSRNETYGLRVGIQIGQRADDANSVGFHFP